MGLPMELFSTTNLKVDYLVGQQGSLELTRNAVWTLDTGIKFSTSYLIEVHYRQIEPTVLEMIVHTKNSTYVFRSFQP